MSSKWGLLCRHMGGRQGKTWVCMSFARVGAVVELYLPSSELACMPPLSQSSYKELHHVFGGQAARKAALHAKQRNHGRIPPYPGMRSRVPSSGRLVDLSHGHGSPGNSLSPLSSNGALPTPGNGKPAAATAADVNSDTGGGGGGNGGVGVSGAGAETDASGGRGGNGGSDGGGAGVGTRGGSAESSGHHASDGRGATAVVGSATAAEPAAAREAPDGGEAAAVRLLTPLNGYGCVGGCTAEADAQ